MVLYKSPHSGNRHFRNYVSTDIHNMNDDDIIGVLSNDELNRVEGLYQNGLNGFVKDIGF